MGSGCSRSKTAAAEGDSGGQVAPFGQRSFEEALYTGHWEKDWNRCCEVRLFKGRNLVIKDGMRMTSDPFCVVESGGYRKQSIVQPNTLDPEWNENFGPFVVGEAQNYVKLTIWDHDDTGSPDYMGECRIPLSEFDKVEKTAWFELLVDETHEKARVSGEILVAFRLMEKDIAELVWIQQQTEAQHKAKMLDTTTPAGCRKVTFYDSKNDKWYSKEIADGDQQVMAHRLGMEDEAPQDLSYMISQGASKTI